MHERLAGRCKGVGKFKSHKAQIYMEIGEKLYLSWHWFYLRDWLASRSSQFNSEVSALNIYWKEVTRAPETNRCSCLELNPNYLIAQPAGELVRWQSYPTYVQST
jgi:hypothetical protein